MKRRLLKYGRPEAVGLFLLLLFAGCVDSANEQIRSIVRADVEELKAEYGGSTPVSVVNVNIRAVNEKRSFLYGNYSLLLNPDEPIPTVRDLFLKTDDGGATWKKIPMDNGRLLKDLRFIGDRGWLSWYWETEGPLFGLLRTADGGETWEECKLGGLRSRPWGDAWGFATAEEGVCLVREFTQRGDGLVWHLMKTTDGGKNFVIQKTLTDADDQVLEEIRGGIGNFKTQPSALWQLSSDDDFYYIKHREHTARAITIAKKYK